MHVLLSLAIAAEWDGIQVGGELRLDASAQRLDLVGTGDGPVYDVGISRGALMSKKKTLMQKYLLDTRLKKRDQNNELFEGGQGAP